MDLFLVLIIALSTFLGYKKGLVELGAKLFAGIIAIIITLVIYKPVGNIVIKNTNIDEKIENTILEKTQNIIDENSNVSNNKYIQNTTENAVTQVKEEVLPEQAKNIAVSVVYIASVLIIFIVTKIILSIVISLANSVASLPILKQFNEVGGLLYGLVRGAIIAFAFILIIGTVARLNPNGALIKNFESTYLTKEIYNSIVKIK